MEPVLNVHLNKITEAHELWKQHLPDIQLYYAMKCNPHPMILQHIHELGIYFDCASKQEIMDALRWTTSDRIIYAHPCKFSSHITYSKETCIPLTVVDCECEMYKMKELYPDCKLLLRIAVNDESSKCKLSSKFGCKMSDVYSLLVLSKQLNLSIVGFSFHVGSGCTQPSLYYDALWDCYTATMIAESLGIFIDTIDIGGGFTKTNFISCAEQVKKGLSLLQGKKIISEVGRFLVEQSCTLYLQVVCKKKEDQRIYYLNDGVYGNLNCKIFDHATPVLQSNKPGKLFKSRVYGPTCDSFDLIEESILLPELEVGDEVFIEDFGAYTNASATSFNGYTVETIQIDWNLDSGQNS